LLSKLGHLQRLDIFWTEFASVYVGHEHEKWSHVRMRLHLGTTMHIF
jgi:hypothetical protein